jgi:nucleotide-binding universal stress UspA family protein
MTDGSNSGERHAIVVGVDGSASSKSALRWAARWSTATGAPVMAVLTWEMPMNYGWGYSAFPEDWNPQVDGEKYLAQTIDEVFGSQRPTGMVLAVREGKPAQVLLDFSRDAEMLVVGSRGHGGFVGLLMGSVSSTCAEHATCPVLVVHDEASELAGQ